jgi:hypothetical protein
LIEDVVGVSCLVRGVQHYFLVGGVFPLDVVGSVSICVLLLLPDDGSRTNFPNFVVLNENYVTKNVSVA